MKKRIKEILTKLRKNRRRHPPKIKRDGKHVKVGGDGERLREDFKSSGT